MVNLCIPFVLSVALTLASSPHAFVTAYTRDQPVTKQIDRRALLQSAGFLSLSLPSLLVLPERAHASAELKTTTPTKPFASKEALLPAVRVKMSIDRAVDIARKAIDDSSSASSDSLLELERIILKPQNYVGALKLQGVPQKPAKLYLDSYKPMSGDLPFQQYLIKNGDINQWRDLKRKEKEKERTNEIRAALNAYTDALSFSADTYLLNVDKATRSRMVREDRLPDVKQVITSDMGMRYLYRNQILTAMDDVRAELEYQLSKEGQIDAKELFDLLTEAQSACARWFSLIDPNDVQEAIETVAMETGKWD